MYAELAALYKYNGRHEEGLDLLYRLSQRPGDLDRPARGAAAGGAAGVRAGDGRCWRTWRRTGGMVLRQAAATGGHARARAGA